MLSISVLLFFFLVAFTFVCLLVLLALAPDNRLKTGYGLVIATYIGWVWLLYNLPQTAAAGWLYLLPLLWIVFIFRFGFPRTPRHQEFPPQPPELRFTQESLRGAAGTREAVTYYFLLVTIGLIVTTVFLYSSRMMLGELPPFIR